MRTPTLVRAGLACALLLAVTSLAWGLRQGSSPYVLALSREVSFNAGGAQTVDVISREFSFSAGDTQSIDVVSREFSFHAGGGLGIDVVSREFSFATAPAGANLVVAADGTSVPPSGTVQQPFEVRWRVRNIGQLAAPGNWVDEVRFSRPVQPLSGPPQEVFRVTGPPGELAVGASYDRVLSFVMPQTEVPFTATFTTDRDGSLSEVLEDDNQRGPFTITPVWPKPNLETEIQATTTGSVQSGTFASIRFKIWNSGDAPAASGSWIDRVWLRRVSTGDLWPLRTFTNPGSLAPDPGGAGTVPGTYYEWIDEPLPLPPGLMAAADYFLEVRTDAGGGAHGAVLESDERDNADDSSPTPFAITDPPRPDLRVAALSLQQGPPGTLLLPWMLVDVRWNVENRTGAPAHYPGGAPWTEIWICTNGSSTGTDVFDGRRLARFQSALPQLPAGSSFDLQRTVQIPPNLAITHPSSAYHFKVLIDADGQVAEAEVEGSAPYWNNLRVHGAYELGVSAANADLEARSVAAVPGPLPFQLAQPLTVRWEVGPLPPLPPFPSPTPLAWVDEIWLSADTTLSANDHWLGTFAEAALTTPGNTWAVGGYVKTATVALPSAVASGTYHLIVRVDVQDTVFEQADAPGSPNNQTFSAATIVLDHLPADLALAVGVPGGPSAPPASAAPGATIQLPWTVTNVSPTGVTSSASWRDQVHLSESQNDLVNSQLLVERWHSGALTPGASYSELRSAMVPAVPPRAYWLHFTTDVDGVVIEPPSDASNTYAVPFEVTAQLADLVVDVVSAGVSPQLGESIVATWVVRNASSAVTPANRWIDSVYLSTVADPQPGDEVHLLGSVERSAPLPPGNVYSAEAAFSIPIGVLPGSSYVVVRTDAPEAMPELDEDNNQNWTSAALEIGPPPPGGGGGGTSGQGWLPANLVTSNVRTQAASMVAGQPVTILWDLANTGVAPTSTASWSDRAWLSEDSILGAGDVALGQLHHGAVLDAGSAAPFGATFDVPLSATGTWFVIVDADASGSVYQDGATADDVAASAIPLLVLTPPLCDLAVESVTGPTLVHLGAPFPVDWNARNVSGSSIPAEWAWRDAVWLIPDVPTPAFPAAGGRFLGSFASTAGMIDAGTAQPQSVVVGAAPPVVPGDYRVVVVADALGQIAESVETPNHAISAAVRLEAVDLPLDGYVDVPLPSGSSRWLALTAPADLTVDLDVVHTSAQARCELYARIGELPVLGNFDFTSEGQGALEPWRQTLRIPRTTGQTVYVLARSAEGVATGTARIHATARPLGISSVSPLRAGTGIVTFRVEGAELWNAATLVLTPAGAPGGVADLTPIETRLDGDRFLARFDLTSAAVGDWRPVLVPTSGTPAPWSETIRIEPDVPLAIRAEIETPPSIRRGEGAGGVLRIRNVGNVDLPFGLAVVGHGHDASAITDALRARLTGPTLSSSSFTDDARDWIAAVVEDLPPGAEFDVPIRLDIGGQFDLSGASFGLAARPLDRTSLEAGLLTELSHRLRSAASADPALPSQLSPFVANPAVWDGAFASALAAGLIPYDAATLHTSDSAAKGMRELAEVVARGMEVVLALPDGVEVPEGAIDSAARAALCSPFADVPGFDCSALTPVTCGQATHVASVTVFDGANVPTASSCTETPAPSDPTIKTRPRGIGPQNTVRADGTLGYTVHFENQAGATAWASRVAITDALEPGFRASSVRFQELRVGPTTLTFPPNTASWVGQVLHESAGGEPVLCQVSLYTDALDRTIKLVLQAIDPVTGIPPTGGDEGLLAPSQFPYDPLASGYLRFTVVPGDLPLPGVVPQHLSGQARRNSAESAMNAEPPLTTNTTSNVLDGRAPSSGLIVVPVAGPLVRLEWGGSDVEALTQGEFGGTGLASYSVYAARSPLGPWWALATNTTQTSLLFTGPPGVPVSFKVEAVDGVGNEEAKQSADATFHFP